MSDIKTHRKLRIDFDPTSLFVGVKWHRTFMGWSKNGKKGYLVNVVVCLIPGFPISYTSLSVPVDKIVDAPVGENA